MYTPAEAWVRLAADADRITKGLYDQKAGGLAALAHLRGETVRVVPRHPRFGARLAYPDAWFVGWRGERPVFRVRATMRRRV